MATLAQVRTELVTITGRSDFTATPANGTLMINKAQRWMEEKILHPLTKRRSLDTLAIGTKVIAYEKIRSILEIHMHKNSDGTKHTLKRKSFDEIYTGYSDATSNGTPKYYAIGVASPSPDDETNQTTGEGGDDMLAADWFAKTQILLDVPVDVAYTAHTLAYFYSNELSSDSDVSIWTLNYPHQLVLATIHQIDLQYRNEDGVAESFTAARDAMREIEKDVIQMEMDDDMVHIGE